MRNAWARGRLTINIGSLLKLYAKEHAGWSVASGTPGVKLEHEQDILDGPDIGLVRSERAPSGKGSDRWLDGAPDLVVEIVGDAKPASVLVRKASQYFKNGAQLVWVVEPEAKSVIVLTPPDHVGVVSSGEAIDGAKLLPGFRAMVADFFE